MLARVWRSHYGRFRRSPDITMEPIRLRCLSKSDSAFPRRRECSNGRSNVAYSIILYPFGILGTSRRHRDGGDTGKSGFPEGVGRRGHLERLRVFVRPSIALRRGSGRTDWVFSGPYVGTTTGLGKSFDWAHDERIGGMGWSDGLTMIFRQAQGKREVGGQLKGPVYGDGSGGAVRGGMLN